MVFRVFLASVAILLTLTLSSLTAPAQRGVPGLGAGNTAGRGVFSPDSGTVIPTQPPPLTDLDTVLLNVSVTGPGNNAVKGIALDRFHVFEDGEEQKLTYFWEDSRPITVGFVFDDSARENVLFGDTMSQRFKQMIDNYLEQQGINAPPTEPDSADEPDPDASCVTPINRLNLAEAGVSTIIWTTGFTAKFDWLKVPVLDNDGMPIHRRGVAPVQGIYFLGFPWLHKRKSGVIYGIEEDARFIVNLIGVRGR